MASAARSVKFSQGIRLVACAGTEAAYRAGAITKANTNPRLSRFNICLSSCVVGASGATDDTTAEASADTAPATTQCATGDRRDA